MAQNNNNLPRHYRLLCYPTRNGFLLFPAINQNLTISADDDDMGFKAGDLISAVNCKY